MKHEWPWPTNRSPNPRRSRARAPALGPRESKAFKYISDKQIKLKAHPLLLQWVNSKVS